MAQNNNEHLELEELKTAYNLIDKRLDGQEIVSDEQLRKVMERRLTGVHKYAKTLLLSFNVIAIPLMVLLMYVEDRLDKDNIIGLVIMWIASLLFGILFLKNTGRENYAYLDMTTVCKRDAKYQKLLKCYNITACLYWIAYSLIAALFHLHSTEEFIVWFILALLVAGAAAFGIFVGKTFHDELPIDPKTGMRSTPKWLNILIIIIVAIWFLFRIITKIH